jgi:hypothetical protein
MRRLWLLSALTLAGCAAAPPLADMTDVDPVVYQRVLDGCEAASAPDDAAGPLVVGTVMGASFGLGIGSLFAYVSPMTAATGYSAGSGAVAGAGAAAVATNTKAGAAISPGPPQSVAQCLEAHGYKIIGHS